MTDGPWDELDRGFFASAPPDVPEPAPEPMRFDDLEDVAQPTAQHRAAAWRASVTASARAVRRRLAPVRASAAATWRRVTPASLAAARALARIGRAQSARLVALLQKADARDRRLLAAGLAALLVVMGVSAGVVASRGSGAPAPVAARSAGAGAVACDTPSSPAFSIAPDDAREIAPDEELFSPALSIAPDRDPLLAPFPAAPDRAAPAAEKRKHAKSVTHHPVRPKVADATPAAAKPASKISAAAAARPAR